MRLLFGLSLTLPFVACGRSPGSAEAAPSTVSIAWVGQDTGRFSATAEASWCAADSMLQVMAARADTGFGFALFMADTLRPGQHPVMSPEVVVDWRPLASVALRWLDDIDLRGFEGNAGTIGVTAVDSLVSGTIDVRLKKPGGDDSLRLTGSFRAIPIKPAPGACGRIVRPKKG